MRIFNSLINAYEYALNNNCDYFLSTHSDAWIFDLNPIYNLLNDDTISHNAVFCRMGINASIDNSFSEFFPAITPSPASFGSRPNR